ncbi:MAG: hypothetical protein PF447_01065 [Spirochaetaceae bacterium]|jgi:beta-N-acetylhexosaminidase|nr:hypothetical protein [Spirochaetaceae bacterium]
MSKKIEEILSSLSTEEKAAQTIIPILFTFIDEEGIEKELEHWKSFTSKNGLGGFFFIKGDLPVLRRFATELQAANSKVPGLIAADLENGAGRFDGCTSFPDLLALGAANDETSAYQMGKAAALEGLSFGVNWTYSPVLDIMSNPENPITQNRCYGDDPEKIIAMSTAHIKGMQDHGLAACAKHFPGDGLDSHDQHICTSVNDLSMEDWMDSFGRIYKESFKADVWTVMIGHIALPAWDDEKSIYNIPQPATLSKKIVTDLLRKELGFKGLIVTDAMGMGGVTGSLDRKDRIIKTFNAGSDMLLFTKIEDFDSVLQGVQEGRISMERLNDAVRHILELKEKLGLLENYIIFGDGPSVEKKKQFEEAAMNIAHKSMVIVRNDDKAFPIKESRGNKKALMVSLVHHHFFEDTENGKWGSIMMDALKERGYDVDHRINPDIPYFEFIAADYDRIFINFIFPAEWGIGSSRSVGVQNRMFMGNFLRESRGKAIFTSFASPYHLRDVPQLPNYINVHSFSERSQLEVVKAWFGEVDIKKNISPVSNLSRF